MTPYHVTLGGQGFLIDPASYVVRSLAQVPAGALPAGEAPATADPFYERVQRQRQFGQGDGVRRFADPGQPDGWVRGSGVVPGPGGSLRLGPLVADSGAGPVFGQGARAFAVFRGRLYVGLEAAPGEVWSFDGATWSLAFTTGKPGVRSLAVYRDALYVGNGGDGTVQRWDGSALTTAWTNASVASVSAMAVAWFDGSARLFLGNSASAGPGWLQAFDGSAQSIVAVLEEPRVEALAVADGRLYVGAADPTGQPRGSLYAYAGAAAGLAHERAFGDGYPVSAATLEARLVLGWSAGDRVLAWDRRAGTLADLLTGSAEGAGPDPVRALVAFGGALWAGFRDPAGGSVAVRRYDPARGAWSVAVAGVAGDEALALGVFGGSLYLGVARAAGGAEVSRLGLDGFESPGEVETPPFDHGLPDLEKSLRLVELRHAPLPAGASIGLDYRLDTAAAWQTLGSADVAGTEVTTLPFPPGTVARGTAFRARLARGPALADGPELREIALRAVLAPAVRRQWELAVLLEGDAQRPLRRLDNTLEPRSARQLAAALWALRAEPGPLPFVDLEGRARQVWFRELKEVLQRRAQADPASPWTVAHLVLVEA